MCKVVCKPHTGCSPVRHNTAAMEGDRCSDVTIHYHPGHGSSSVTLFRSLGFDTAYNHHTGIVESIGRQKTGEIARAEGCPTVTLPRDATEERGRGLEFLVPVPHVAL